MDGVGGIEATRRIIGGHPGTRVVLVSTYGVGEIPPGARASGAIAYLHKEDLTPHLIGELWATGGDPSWAQTFTEGESSEPSR